MYKVRSSGSGAIMGGNVGASAPQLANIQKMDEREKPMTATQQEKYDKDIEVRDNPQLPAGIKTVCELWHKEKIYKRRKEISGNPLEKGNFCESASIDFINTQLLEDYQKNEEYKESEFITGTADIVADDLIIDIKNSYTFDTFPLHDFGIKNKDYFYQLQCYMYLYGKSKATLCYTLMNMPFHMIEREAKRKAFYENKDYDQVFSEVFNQLTYDDIDPKYRYKMFHIEFDMDVIDKIKERVKLCRIYINELDERIASQF